MKRLIPLLMVLSALFPSCKEEEFPEPEQVFRRWTSSLKNLNYQDYRSCEAYPKEEGVFREMFRYTYYRDCGVKEFDDLDEGDVKKDFQGNKYLERKVLFECAEVARKTGKQLQTVRGDVAFVKFLSGSRDKDGWLLWHRTMYRINQ